MQIEAKRKKRYNLTYLLRNSGIKINTRKRCIYFNETNITGIAKNHYVTTMLRDYNYTLIRDPQLKINF